MIGIIIPTKNRSEFMKRQLYYYAKVQCPYTIYIGDSSDQEHANETLATVEKLKGQIKVVYKSFPDLRGEDTIKSLVNMVQEKYSAYIGDDDYLIPKSLEKCATFLDAQPDYSTAQGIGVLFTLKSNGAYGEFRNVAPYYLYGLEENSPSRRLINFWNHAWVTQFSVHRTEEFVEAVEPFDSIPDRGFTECICNSISIIQGKSKTLNDLYLIRQGHSQRYMMLGGMDWITDPNWQPSFQVFHDVLAKMLTQKTEVTMEKASEIVKTAFRPHLARSLTKSYIQKTTPSKFQRNIFDFKRSLSKQFPRLKSLYKQIQDPMGISLPQLLTPSSAFNEDFLPIYNSITTTSNQSTIVEK